MTPDNPATFVVKVYPGLLQIFKPTSDGRGVMIEHQFDELWEGTLLVGDIIKKEIENPSDVAELAKTHEEPERLVRLT